MIQKYIATLINVAIGQATMAIQWHSQDTEVARAQGLRGKKKKIHLHFSVTRMDSRGIFMLRTASNPCLVRLADLRGLVPSQEL